MSTNEKQKFETLKLKDFGATFDILNYVVVEDSYKYADRFWYNLCKILEETYVKDLPFNFLQIPQIKETMFVENPVRVPKQLQTISKNFPDSASLSEFLKENEVGQPSLVGMKIKEDELTSFPEEEKSSSPNTIHHAYHLCSWNNQTNPDLSSVNTVLEWGGGYGNFAKMTQRFFDKIPTYIIVDVPFFAALQWMYLATIYGEDKVCLVTKQFPTIQKNKFNIVSSGNLSLLKDIKVDMFISTWALSESKPEAIEWLNAHKWLQASHFLLAYYAEPETMFSKETINLLEKYLSNLGVVKTKIDAFDENEQHYYLFK